MGCPHDNIWDHCFTVWQVVTSWEVWADKASKLDSTLQMLEVEAMTIFASTLQEKTEKLTTHAEDTKECWQHCSMPWYGTNFSVNSFLVFIWRINPGASLVTLIGDKVFRRQNLSTWIRFKFWIAKFFKHFGCWPSSWTTAMSPKGRSYDSQSVALTQNSRMFGDVIRDISWDIIWYQQRFPTSFFTLKSCTFERLDAGREPMSVPFGTKTRHLLFKWFTLLIFCVSCEKCVLVTYVVDTQKNW